MYRTKYYDLAITYSVVLCPVLDLRWIIYFAWIIYVLTGIHDQNFETLTGKYLFREGPSALAAELRHKTT